MKKHLANSLTALRIVCSIALLFLEAFSVPFYGVYILAGLTDMLDGPVARKMGTVSEFGSILDTAADMCFAGVCLFKMLPTLDIPLWLWIWLAVIVLIKLTNVILEFVIHKEMTAQHTIMNKITGALLFAFPMVLPVVDLNISAAVLCGVATFGAIQEGYKTICGR